MLTSALLCTGLLLGQSGSAAKVNASELKKLQGEWFQHSSEFKGVDTTPKKPGNTFLVKGAEYKWKMESGRILRVALKIDATKEPKHIDRIASDGAVSVGIYKLENDTLTICQRTDGGVRPTEFKTTPEGGSMVVWKRLAKNN